MYIHLNKWHFLCDCRKECVLKERRFKDEIVDLAKSINKESQEVVRIATSTAEACTDRRMKTVRFSLASSLDMCIVRT